MQKMSDNLRGDSRDCFDSHYIFHLVLSSGYDHSGIPYAYGKMQLPFVELATFLVRTRN